MSEVLGSQVGFEYIGLARDLRRRVEVTAAETKIRAAALVSACIGDFNRRNRGPRLERILAISQVWQQLPAFGLLDQTIHRDKKSLRIIEHRLVVNKLVTLPNVDHHVDEPGLVVMQNRLDLLPRSAEFQPTAIATISLHALARRFQRGYGDDEQTVLGDIGGLVPVAADLIAAGPAPVRVPALSGGKWSGEVAMLRAPDDPDCLALIIRTFLQ